MTDFLNFSVYFDWFDTNAEPAVVSLLIILFAIGLYRWWRARPVLVVPPIPFRGKAQPRNHDSTPAGVTIRRNLDFPLEQRLLRPPLRRVDGNLLVRKRDTIVRND